MSVIRWLASCCTNRGKALSQYRRGMVRAKRHDHQGAIDAYSLAISCNEAPTDVRAMARYNRALVYLAIGDEEKCAAELHALIDMTDAPVNVRTMSRQKIARLELRAQREKA